MLTTEILFDYDPMVDDERRVSSGGDAAAAAAEAPEAAAAVAAGAGAESARGQAGGGHLVGSKVKKHFGAYTYAGKQHPAAWFEGEVIETFLKVRLRCSPSPVTLRRRVFCERRRTDCVCTGCGMRTTTVKITRCKSCARS